MTNTLPIALAVTAITTLSLCGAALLLRQIKWMLLSAVLNAIALTILTIGFILIIDDQIGRPLDHLPAAASFFLCLIFPAACYCFAFWRQTIAARSTRKGAWWLAGITGLLLLTPLLFVMALVTECALGNCL